MKQAALKGVVRPGYVASESTAHLDARVHPAIAVPVGSAIGPITGARRGRWCRRGEKTADDSTNYGSGKKAMVMVMMVVVMMILNALQLGSRIGLRTRRFIGL
jgi:hypothetical protein